MAIKTICRVFLLFIGLHYCNGNLPSNIVFILTDDQDIVLGGMDPLQKTNRLIRSEGAEFKNMFVTTPLCCPSRSSILTGRYVHNHGTHNNSISGGCNSRSWQNGPELNTFVNGLKYQQYVTFYAGKYLNEYGNAKVGGVEHIPPGWDNWVGLVGNSKYYNYDLSVNGSAEKHGQNPNQDYLTNVIRNKSLAFLDSINGELPFFMMLSPPAPHAPFTPEPKYKNKFNNDTAPRTANFNIPGGETKHWLLREPPNPLPEQIISQIDENFRNRWRSLLSVDDLVEDIYKKLQQKNILKNTYIFFSSDNGFHLGQFSLPWDKRQPYEFDIRVPLIIRGPGITPGKVIHAPVLNIDLAPTFLEISGLVAKEMDGLSLLPLLYRDENSFANRTHFIVEHSGEGHNTPAPGCPKYSSGGVTECFPDCICQDSFNNTYICVRKLSPLNNTIFCKFKDNENFQEYYNISADPYQMRNLSPPGKTLLHSEFVSMNLNLKRLKVCRGKLCQI